MKQLARLFTERKGEVAHRQAVAMGLKYKGFGYWVDPSSGEVTHKTEGDQLVPVEPDVESDKWKGDSPEAGMAEPGAAAKKAMGNSFGSFMSQGQAPVAGTQAGEVLPGMEQKPRDLGKWEPGPDGNHCVGDQPAPEAPEADTFVKKTNYMNWTAGADGDNYTSLDLQRMTGGILGKNTSVKEQSYDSIMMEMDVAAGNPSAAMGPAERARQLGLQSNGKGGYIDPNSGQVVAQTVNGELVFYSKNRATGGAVSDSAGGAALVSDGPSWADPVTGMVITPPGAPESPAEQGAVPDPVPAKAPHGYNSFMTQQKQQHYNAQAVMNQMGDMGMNMSTMDFDDQQSVEEDYGGEDMLKRMGQGAPDAGASIAATNVGRVKKIKQAMDAMPNQGKPMPTQPQQTPDQPQQTSLQINKPAEDERRGKIIKALEGLMATPEKKRGAGANDLSDEDITKFMHYVKNGPQNERHDVSDEEMEFANTYLREKMGKSWGSLQNRMKGKGDPEPSRKIVARAQEVLRSYLENLGTSSIDGSPLAFSESELDHITSLANGGVDEGANWSWLPKRFNQFKGALEDNELLEKLQKLRERDPEDVAIKQQEKNLINKMRGDWTERFKNGGWEELNQADILGQKGTTGMQQLKALAEAAGVSYYKDRGVTRSSGRAGGGTSLGVEELQQRLIKELGIPSQVDVTKMDGSLFELLQELEDQRSDLDSAKREQRKKKREAKKKEIKEWIQLHRTDGITFDQLVEKIDKTLFNHEINTNKTEE